MNETAARNILLLRAFETNPDDGRWTDADRVWANQAALTGPAGQAVGGAPEFIARRAMLGVQRLGERDPEIRQLHNALIWRPWVGPLIVAAAFGLGLLTDAIGPARQVNLLAPPLLGILLWNFLVYGLMIAGTMLRPMRRSTSDATFSTVASDGLTGPLNRLVAWLARSPVRHVAKTAGGPADSGQTRSNNGAVVKFTQAWLYSSAPLTTARCAAILHFAAGAFAVGALAALYFRGLGQEFLAGWESTFLDADAVARLLGFVFAPASWLSGIVLPDTSGFANMQFGRSAGVNAAPWIHLYAITLGLFVVLPRLGLGLMSSLKAVRLRSHFGLNTDSPYFESLARVLRGDAASLLVIPYSYQPPQSIHDALGRLLGRVHGADAKITLAPAAAQGEEDNWQLPAQPLSPALAIALFAMTATPENETHAAFASRLRTLLPAATVLVPIVDESGFRERFEKQTGRLEQRRQAWRKVLLVAGLTPLFVDLASPATPAQEQLMIDIIQAGNNPMTPQPVVTG
ncbi:MAG: DUF2868 domain-containing protein [Burkholderiaceae bacterium]